MPLENGTRLASKTFMMSWHKFKSLTLFVAIAATAVSQAMVNLSTAILGPASMATRLEDPTEAEVRRSTVRLTTTLIPGPRTPAIPANQSRTTSCTGLLVRTNVVLTAAHCLHSAGGGATQSVIASFFNPAQPTQIVANIPASRLVKNPAAQGRFLVQNPGSVFLNDVAVVVLVQNAPEGFTPVPVAFVDQQFNGFNDVPHFLLAGYGFVQMGEDGAPNTLASELGVAIARRPTPEESTPFFARLPTGAYPFAPRSEVQTLIGGAQVPLLRLVQDRNNGLIRGGDSGGPAFIRNLRTGQLYVSGNVVGYISFDSESANSGLLRPNEEFVLIADYSQPANNCFLARELGVNLSGCNP